MRTFRKEDVITAVNYEDAEKYIGDAVYLGDSLSYLESQVKNGDYKILEKIVDEPCNFGFKAIQDGYLYHLCLPEEKEIEVES